MPNLWYCLQNNHIAKLALRNPRLYYVSHFIQDQKEHTKQSYQQLLKILNVLDEELLPSRVQKGKHEQSKGVYVVHKDLNVETVH